KRQTRVDAVSPARTVNKVKLLKAPPPTFSVKKNTVTKSGLPFDIVQAHALALKLAREASRKAFVEEAEQVPTMTLPRQVGLQAGGSGITLTRHPPAGAAQDDTRPLAVVDVAASFATVTHMDAPTGAYRIGLKIAPGD